MNIEPTMNRILIFGDYSSLGKSLQIGIKKIGLKGDLISQGDGWRQIEYDSDTLKIKTPKNLFFLGVNFRKIFFWLPLKNFLSILHYIKNKKYDAILVMNQHFVTSNIIFAFTRSQCIHIRYLRNKIKPSGKIYMMACGDDSYYVEKIVYFMYSPYTNGYEGWAKKKAFQNDYEKVLNLVDGIIPNAYDYAESYRGTYWDKVGKLKKMIKMPIDLSDIKYKKNEVKEKIIIFHGLNREDFKGTEYIKMAMENMKSKYPDKIDIIIDGRLPLKKYLEIMEGANIVIDQCKSYGYGMNALYALAQGKIVFSGNEPEIKRDYGDIEIPVVNILPDVEDIEKKIEYYILNPHLIEEIGLKGRKFVEDHHECSKVAKEYLEIFNEDSDEKTLM